MHKNIQSREKKRKLSLCMISTVAFYDKILQTFQLKNTESKDITLRHPPFRNTVLTRYQALAADHCSVCSSPTWRTVSSLCWPQCTASSTETFLHSTCWEQTTNPQDAAPLHTSQSSIGISQLCMLHSYLTQLTTITISLDSLSGPLPCLSPLGCFRGEVVYRRTWERVLSRSWGAGWPIPAAHIVVLWRCGGSQRIALQYLALSY